MPQIVNRQNGRAKGRSERPPLYAVFLMDDGKAPHDLVFAVLRSVFRLSEGQALVVVAAVARSEAGAVGAYTQEIAEMKAIQAIRLGRSQGYLMTFATQRVE